MTETNATATDTVIIRAPGSAEIRWRTQRMTSLGADAALAAEIAKSRADVHEIERLLEAGCPLGLAWAIVRPLQEAETAEAVLLEAAPEAAVSAARGGA